MNCLTQVLEHTLKRLIMKWIGLAVLPARYIRLYDPRVRHDLGLDSNSNPQDLLQTSL
jgi:hypothetical protein